MATNTQQTTSAGDASGGSKINAFQAFAHLPRTLKVAGAVMRDSRVQFLPKALFVGSVVFILAGLIAPELAGDLGSILLLPGIGDLLGLGALPVEGVFDWMALGLLALNLMKMFPQEIVNEHFDNIVAKSKPTGPIVDADPVR